MPVIGYKENKDDDDEILHDTPLEYADIETNRTTTHPLAQTQTPVHSNPPWCKHLLST
jgi:hypothetical protein